MKRLYLSAAIVLIVAQGVQIVREADESSAAARGSGDSPEAAISLFGGTILPPPSGPASDALWSVASV